LKQTMARPSIRLSLSALLAEAPHCSSFHVSA
jgi:hypothetical protein